MQTPEFTPLQIQWITASLQRGVLLTRIDFANVSLRAPGGAVVRLTATADGYSVRGVPTSWVGLIRAVARVGAP